MRTDACMHASPAASSASSALAAKDVHRKLNRSKFKTCSGVLLEITHLLPASQQSSLLNSIQCAAPAGFHPWGFSYPASSANSRPAVASPSQARWLYWSELRRFEAECRRQARFVFMCRWRSPTCSSHQPGLSADPQQLSLPRCARRRAHAARARSCAARQPPHPRLAQSCQSVSPTTYMQVRAD